MSFNVTHAIQTGLNYAGSTYNYATKTAINYLKIKDCVQTCFLKNLDPQTLTQIEKIGAFINNSDFAKILAEYGTTPANLGFLGLGVLGGNFFMIKKLLLPCYLY